MNRPGRRLRIGILLDDTEVPAWFFEMIRRVHGGAHADVCLIVEDATPPGKEKHALVRVRERGALGTASAAIGKAIDLAYGALIDRPGAVLRDAFEPRDILALLPDVPRIACRPERSRYSDRFRPDDVDTIREHGLDLMIRLGFRILRGDILTSVPMGIWSYHHGDSRTHRGGPPGFWETMLGAPVTGAVLQVLNEDLDNGVALYRSYSTTDPMSVTNNRNNCYWKSALFVERVIEAVQREGFDAYVAQCRRRDRSLGFYTRPLRRPPTNGEYARLVLQKLYRKVRSKLAAMTRFEQWVLLYDWREELSSSMWRYRKVLPPKDRIWADPHVITRDGRYYVFLEEYLHEKENGHISVVEFDQDGPRGAPVPVLVEPHHLSYPFVFEHEGKVFMLPEASQSRRVDLYEATRFPFEWRVRSSLLTDIRALDPTLLHHAGRWWLFANVKAIEGVSSSDELYVFYADSLLEGDWKPHRKNPVVSDCRQARPAGRIFERGGNLYRPSQNCSWRYGYGFRINEITRLTPDAYDETIVDSVEPLWEKDLIGTHTFNRCGPLHLSDGLLRRRKRGRR